MKLCDYVADFSYKEGDMEIDEDFKGERTPIYNLKRRMMLAFHGITIRETGYADLA